MVFKCFNQRFDKSQCVSPKKKKIPFNTLGICFSKTS